MSEQGELDLDFERNERLYDGRPTPKGYARRPGSGPEGESCGSCKHLIRHGNTRNFYKCGLVKWTLGAATDIRLRSPACEMWERRETP